MKLEVVDWVVVEGLTIRNATPGDTNRIAELLGGDPGDEAIGLLGSAEKAIAFGMGVVRLPNSPPGWRRWAGGESYAAFGVPRASHLRATRHADVRATAARQATGADAEAPALVSHR